MRSKPTPATLADLNQILEPTQFTQDLGADELCDLAMECEGNTAQTVAALIEGVMVRYGDVLDEAACAALNAVRYWHVPQLQDTTDGLDQHRRGE